MKKKNDGRCIKLVVFVMERSISLILQMSLIFRHAKSLLIFDAFIVSADSKAHLAKCSVKTKLSSFSNLSLASVGSSQKTSKAAPAIFY